MPSTSTDRLNGLTTSVAVKAPCVAATTANITLSGLQTIDGVALAEGDRVLVRAQSTTSQNGIYAASSGTWTRTADADGVRDLRNGTLVHVAGGSTISGVYVAIAATAEITPGTTSVAFTLATSTTLGAQLASIASALLGGGMIGHDVDLNYASGTSGHAINAHGRVLQGADPSGATASTTAMKALFDLCIPNGYVAVIPGGTYTVDGPITGTTLIASGGLFIHCAGDVVINVDAAATAFTYLIHCYTTAINNSTITGGRLTLNLNSKCSNGIFLRHDGGDGGVVNWQTSIEVNDAKENDSAVTAENNGLLVYGRYVHVFMNAPRVDGVDRVRNPGGACKGISISDTVGTVVLLSPFVARVLAGPGALQDADGISVFARQRTSGLTNIYDERPGLLVIDSPWVEDCQGRGIKTQVSRSVIRRPFFKRKSVVAFATAELDHQIGGHHVIEEPSYLYEKDSGVSPVPSSWYALSMQVRCEDMPTHFETRGGTVLSEVPMHYFGFVTYGNTTDDAAYYDADPKSSTVVVDGLVVHGLGALAGGVVFSRNLVEFHMGRLQNNANSHNIEISNTRMNLAGLALLGYASGAASDADNLSCTFRDNENVGSASGVGLFEKMSGTTPTSFAGRFIRVGNIGFSDDRWESISGTGPGAPTTGYGKVANGGATNMSTMVPLTNRVHDIVTLRFDNANTTLVHGTGTNAISLNGAINTTPAAGSFVVLAYDSTDVAYWREVSRSY